MAKSSDPSKKPKTVELQRDGQNLFIYPALPEFFGTFYTVDHAVESDASHGYKITRRPVSLMEPGEDFYERECFACRAGLEPLVEQWLCERGYKVKNTSARSRRLREPNHEELERVWPVDQRLLEVVREHDRATIRYNGGMKEAVQIISQIALAWKKRVIVLTTRTKDADRIGAALGKLGIRVTVVHNRRPPEAKRAKRVALATYAFARDGALEIEQRDIVIALNPAELLRRQQGLDAINCIQDARLYGLLSVQQGLPQNELDTVTAAFGPPQIRFRRSVETSCPNVVFLPTKAADPLHGVSANSFVAKKEGVWHHLIRNRRIARLTRMLIDNDQEGLCKDFSPVADQLGDCTAQRVGILVENVEHGLVLAKQLPDLPILTRSDVFKSDLYREQKDRLAHRSHPRPLLSGQEMDHVIFTSAAIGGAGKFDVLIRADGGMGPFPGTSRIVSKGSFVFLQDALLVDFMDHHNPILARWSRARKETYWDLGWTGQGPMDSERLLREFLDTRPEVM